MRQILLIGFVCFVGACSKNGTAPPRSDGGADMAGSLSFDMELPPCVSTPPMTNVEFLNACTNAQPGDPAKDYPYFPSLAPAGMLPSLP